MSYSTFSQSPQKQGQSMNMRHSYQATTVTKSQYSSPGSPYLPGFSKAHEIPLDPHSQYTICYVPGMSEHTIETGKTFEDAKMKIVTLTCELERVNTYNYSLVREVEVLRVQANKSEREKDLETKLAIVLAENEKLNRIIEEVYEVYISMRDHHSVSHSQTGSHEYEARMAELLGDLEQWKRKYNALESQNNVVDLQNQIKDLKNQKDMLSEQVTRKDRDLEAMRARLNSLGNNQNDNANLNQRLAALTAENQSLQRELEALKLQYGRADNLQLKLSQYDAKVRTVLEENEKLNGILRDKLEEIKRLKDMLEHANNRHQEIAVNMNRQAEEKHKNSAANQKAVENRLQSLIEENDQLRHENEGLKNELNRLNQELERLRRELPERDNRIMMLTQKIQELEGRLRGAGDMEAQLRNLNQELERLRRELPERDNRIMMLTQKIQELEGRLQGAGNLEVQLRNLNQELDRLRRELSERENRIAMFTQKIQELEGRLRGTEGLEAQIRALMMEKKELEERAVRITIEVDRLQGMIRDLKAENDGLKRRMAELEHHKASGDRELIEISKQFEGVKAMNLQNRDFQMKFEAERKSYETQIMQLEQIKVDLERKIQMLSVECERVTTLSVQRLSMIEDLKKNNNEEKYKLEVYGLKNQMEVVKSHAYDIEQAAAQYAGLRSVDQSKINELTQINASCRAELDNVRGLLEKRRLEVEGLAAQNEDLRRMCEQIRYSASNNNGIKIEAVEMMQNKIAELERSRSDYQRQAERNSVDLTRKNKELVDKIHEMDVLKLKYEEALANYQALNSQLFSRISVQHH